MVCKLAVEGMTALSPAISSASLFSVTTDGHSITRVSPGDLNVDFLSSFFRFVPECIVLLSSDGQTEIPGGRGHFQPWKMSHKVTWCSRKRRFMKAVDLVVNPKNENLLQLVPHVVGEYPGLTQNESSLDRRSPTWISVRFKREANQNAKWLCQFPAFDSKSKKKPLELF